MAKQFEMGKKMLATYRIGRVAFAVWAIWAVSQAHAEDTSRFVFVTEYVRGLSALENVRVKAEEELKADATANDKLSTSIYASTRFQLELKNQIYMLRDMHLSAPFEELIPNIVHFDQMKIDLHQQMIDIGSTMLARPKLNVDYGKMVADMPKIRAFLDDIDHALFESTPMIFATLINETPDSNNHISRLIIKRAEREKLLQGITNYFGEKVEQKNQNYIVSSASVLKAYLLKGYTCSDEHQQ
jgi:hypothetical protein